MTIDELQVLITADVNNLRKEIQSSNKMLSELEKTATKSNSSVSGAIMKSTLASTALSKAISIIGQNVGGAITRLDALNNYPKVMSNLGVATEDSEASMARLNEGLQGLPTTLDSATIAVQRFTSANGDVKASTEMYLALNNAILAGGASAEIQNMAMEQLSQSYAKGKPDMMEWRSAMTAMPAQLKQVAIAMGYASADQLGESLRNGEISMNDFMATLVELNYNGINGFQSFEQQARNSTGGVATSIIAVKTALQRGIADIMNLVGQSNIANFFYAIRNAINAVIPYIAGFIKAMLTAFGLMGKVFGKSTTPTVNQTTKSMSNLGAVSGGVVSDGLKKATGSAKKLNKELQKLSAFDEMTVLQESSSNMATPGAGGSGGGSGGFDMGDLGDMGDLDFDMDTSGLDDIATKVDEIAKKFAPLVQMLKAVGAGFIFYLGARAIAKGVSGLYNFITGINKADTPMKAFFGTMKDLVKGTNDYAGAITNLSFEQRAQGFAMGASIAVGGFVALWDSMTKLIESGDEMTNTEKVINVAFTAIGAGAIALGTTIAAAMAGATGGMSVIIGAITAVVAVVGTFTYKMYEEEQAMRDTKLTTESLTEAKNNLFNATQNNVNAIDAAEDAQKRLQEAEKISGLSGQALAEQVEQGKLTYENMNKTQREVYKAYLDNKKAQDDLKKSSEELKKAKEEEIDAHAINDVALNLTKGNYTEYRDSVVKAYEDGELSAEEAQARISVAMRGMDDKSRETFTQNLPSDIKEGLNPGKYETTFNKFFRFNVNSFNSIGEWLKKFFTETVPGFFSDMWNKIKTKFTDISKKIGESVTSTFKKAVNGLMSWIQNFVNKVISGINGAVSVINKIPGVNISKIPSVSLPRLAKGGIVDKPTYAIIGEAGKEAVMPLERNTGWIDDLSSKLADKIGGGNGTPIQLVVQLGEETIFEKFIDYTKEKSFQTNGEVFSL